MIQLFKDIIVQLMTIALNVDKDNIKESVVKYILTLVTCAMLCFICGLCLYYGIDVIGNVASYAVRGFSLV